MKIFHVGFLGLFSISIGSNGCDLDLLWLLHIQVTLPSRGQEHVEKWGKVYVLIFCPWGRAFIGTRMSSIQRSDRGKPPIFTTVWQRGVNPNSRLW